MTSCKGVQPSGSLVDNVGGLASNQCWYVFHTWEKQVVAWSCSNIDQVWKHAVFKFTTCRFHPNARMKSWKDSTHMLCTCVIIPSPLGIHHTSSLVLAIKGPKILSLKGFRPRQIRQESALAMGSAFMVNRNTTARLGVQWIVKPTTVTFKLSICRLVFVFFIF